MSVPNQIPYNIYTANGQTTVFTYEFYIISASDLEVSINGSVVTSGYTVSGVGNKDGGDITFLTPPANGAVVMLERVVPTYRLTDYQDNGDLLADTVNKDFDRIWMAIQRAFIDLGFALTRPFLGGPFNAKGYRIANLDDPVDPQDAATKKYVDQSKNNSNAYADKLFKRALRVPEDSVEEVYPISGRRNSLFGWNNSGRPVPIFSMTDTADLAIKLASDDEGLGGDLVGWKRRPMRESVQTVATALDSKSVSIWEYAYKITDKPDESDPSSWDWSPAFQAAHADNVGVQLVDRETYTIKSPLVYTYSSDGMSNYARLPCCPNGMAILKYDSLGNYGEGFDVSKEVDDPTQPEYVSAITIKGLSGIVILQQLEGIYFLGNKNTGAIKMIGCCGVRPDRCIFDANRYGLILNNGDAPGTYTELCSPTRCRWRSGCVTSLAYEKGHGDSSFHGSGFGDECYITVPPGFSPVLIGEGCQPYNAPLKANIWMSGNVAPVIKNKGLTAHFYGDLKLEASYKTVVSEGTQVYFYGAIASWSPIDKGSLTQAVRGGPTGPSAGNLNFSGITEPQITRWDIARAGTTVPFIAYNEESVVTVRGATYYSTFKIITSRRQTNNPSTCPIIVITGNTNPITKFNITRTPAGLSLTTIEDNTVIAARRIGGLPDESAGINYTTADYWRTL
ncbi:phage tail fiber protein [Klebsiella aerogenes]|uniref:phage tail fiber domain-containing protein n=1 Tax=Klebsiella aerogenes TaxID=548 RepID=UPI0031D54FCF